jgi:hypothetical protein
MKIRPVGADLLHAERRTDRRAEKTKLSAILRTRLQQSGNYTLHLLEHPKALPLPGRCLSVSNQSQNNYDSFDFVMHTLCVSCEVKVRYSNFIQMNFEPRSNQNYTTS